MNERDIAIWGGGRFGQKMKTIFESDGYSVVTFVDRESKVALRNVINSKDITDNFVANTVFYVCIRDYYALGDVVFEMHEKGVEGAWIVNPDIYDENEIESISDLKKSGRIYYLDFSNKAVISKLEFHVIDRCNLNCRGCSHFAPEFKNGYVDINDFEKQMFLVSNSFSNVFRFRLMGGEPFLHDQLGEFALIARKYLPHTHLEIVTNGLMYKYVSAENWDLIKRADAVLNISLYPPTFECKHLIEEYLNKIGIKFSFGSGLEQYNDNGIIEEFHKCLTHNATHDAKKAIKRCVGSYCYYLRDGIISKCSLPQLIGVVNEKYGEKYVVDKKDCIELKTVDDPWSIVERLRKPMLFCRYCTDSGVLERFKWTNKGEKVISDYIMEANS